MSNLDNNGLFEAIAKEKNKTKRSRAMGWYLQNWKPGKVERELEMMADLLNEDILKYQAWTTEDNSLVFRAKEFSLTIRPVGGLADIKRFIVCISSVQDITLRYREFFLNPTFLGESATGTKQELGGTTSTQFQNILELWRTKQPVVEFDPFEL
jgi:hypothetical protein